MEIKRLTAVGGYDPAVKIVHVESGRHLYGGARQVLYLIDELARQGVANVLVCAEGAEIASAAAGHADIVQVPMDGDLDFRLTRRISRALATWGPDLLHVHSRRGAELFAGFAAARRSCPAVLTRRVDSREWPPWARLKYARYRAVVAISRSIETQLVERVRVPRERVHHVASGVDPARYRPDPAARDRLIAALDLPPDAVAVGVVAQLIPRKGHAMLLDALRGIAARHPRLQVLFFGRGPLEARLRQRVDRLGLSGCVKMAGFRDDLAELLPGLDIVAHPAASEGLGVAVLEAMSAGVPVIASAAGGLPDLIEHGEQGLLVAPKDSRAWAEAIDGLISDRLQRRRMGAAGRRQVQRRFSAGAMAAGNLAVYRAVLEGRRLETAT